MESYNKDIKMETFDVHVNTLRPRKNGCHFPDDILKCIFLNENVSIWLKVSLQLLLKGLVGNIPSFVQIMAWSRPGDKPLSEPMMIGLPMHICVTQPQWVKRDYWMLPVGISLEYRKSRSIYTDQHLTGYESRPQDTTKHNGMRCPYGKYE